MRLFMRNGTRHTTVFETKWANIKVVVRDYCGIEVESGKKYELTFDQLAALIKKYYKEFGYVCDELKALYYDMAVDNVRIFLELDW